MPTGTQHGSRRLGTVIASMLALMLATTLAGCSSGSGPATVPSPSAASGLLGLGAPLGIWQQRHSAGYADVLTDAQGRVESYVLTMSDRTLAKAVTRVRADLPPDATSGPPQLVEGIEGTKCVLVDFTSPTLGRALGGRRGAEVLAVFQTQAAITLDQRRISHAVVISGNEQRPRQC